MDFPSKNAPTDEIIEFLRVTNTIIHNTILENGDYYSLINELIEAEMGNHYYSFSDAMAALHTSKTRIYAEKRDITHEAMHVYMQMINSVSKDLGRLIIDAGESEEDRVEIALEYLDIRDNADIIPTSLRDSAFHLWNLDYLYNFPINKKNPIKGTIQDLKNHIKTLERSFIKTTSSIYLPLDLLTTAERKHLKTTLYTEDIELLIKKIYTNWDKRKNGVKNFVSSARLEHESQYTINRHLETLGIYRKQYHRFVKEQTLPTKKLVFGMALYFAPNNIEWIEQFMNAFGYSINSNIMAFSDENICTTNNDVLLDRDIRKLLNSGLDTDIILMLLSQKSNEVKKSSSSKNFS